jgi:hypothetical protein
MEGRRRRVRRERGSTAVKAIAGSEYNVELAGLKV